MSDFLPKMTRIRKQVLYIRTTLAKTGMNDNSSPICPECGFTRLKIFIHDDSMKLECHKCYWQDNYMRIRKNGEGIV